MKSIDARLNNIIGQINGIKQMVSTDCDCEKVLTQLKAAKSGLSKVIEEIVEAQFCQEKKLLIKYKKYVQSA